MMMAMATMMTKITAPTTPNTMGIVGSDLLLVMTAEREGGRESKKESERERERMEFNNHCCGTGDGHVTRIVLDDGNICDGLRWWSIGIRDIAEICDCRQALRILPLHFHLDQERECVYIIQFLKRVCNSR